MTESELVHAIRLQFSRGDTRLLRNNCGAFQDLRGNYVTFGLGVGTSDLIGWKRHVIVPRDVGNEVAIFTALEAKRLRGKPTPEQRAFIDTVLEAGGIAGVVRSLADCHKLLGC